jgi:hypothetical protein
MSALIAMWMMWIAVPVPSAGPQAAAAPRSELVMVEGLGPTRLEGFDCTAIARSATVGRLCHDPERRLALAEIGGRWRPFCDVDRDLVDAWLGAPSMGRFLAERLATDHRCD